MAKSDDVGFHSLVLVLGCWLVVIDRCACVVVAHPPPAARLLASINLWGGIGVPLLASASGMQRRSARTCKTRPPVAGGTLHRSTALCASSDRAKSDVFLDF